MYKEYHSVCPLVGIGTLPTPFSPASVPLPPEPGGGHTRLRVRGWGSPNFDDWRKPSALFLFCEYHSPADVIIVGYNVCIIFLCRIYLTAHFLASRFLCKFIHSLSGRKLFNTWASLAFTVLISPQYANINIIGTVQPIVY